MKPRASTPRSNKLEAIKHSESIKRIAESIAINIKENPETQIINTDPKLNKDTIIAIQTTIKNTLKEQLQAPISLPTQSLTANRQVKSPNETLQLWRQSISFTDTNFTPSHIKFVSNNKLRVEFDSEEQRQTTIDKVNLSANKLVKAEEARLLQPMVIVKGIANQIITEELSSIIIKQNSLISEVAVNTADLVFQIQKKQ
ncbi:hypothetical protein ACJJTC_010829 [Scirpophaga incertulas]